MVAIRALRNSIAMTVVMYDFLIYMSAHIYLSSYDAMTILRAQQALLPGGWASNVRVEIDGDGRIAGVTANATASTPDTPVGILLPAPANAHSHAFQRAMAG